MQPRGDKHEDESQVHLEGRGNQTVGVESLDDICEELHEARLPFLDSPLHEG